MFIQDQRGANRMSQEPMSCERFHEVVNEYFPEGHSVGWVDKLLDLPHLPKADDPIYTIPEPNRRREKRGRGDKDKSSKPKVKVEQQLS